MMLHIVLHDVNVKDCMDNSMSKATSFETLCKKTVSERLKNFMYTTTELYIKDYRTLY